MGRGRERIEKRSCPSGTCFAKLLDALHRHLEAAGSILFQVHMRRDSSRPIDLTHLGKVALQFLFGMIYAVRVSVFALFRQAPQIHAIRLRNGRQITPIPRLQFVTGDADQDPPPGLLA